MIDESTKRIAFVSSYLPRKCGIATFCSDLIESLRLSAPSRFDPLVVAMRNEDIKYEEPVKFEIRQNVQSDYLSAADYLNFSHVDLVSVQHEFGLFGGLAGSYLNSLLSRLKAPVITTLHTVLDNPDADYRKSLIDVCDASYKVITMNKRGVTMLKEKYGIKKGKIKLVPHGIPDLPFVDNNYYKHKFGMEGRRTILTFGLLSKNKGIEVMLKALPEIIKVDPSVLYVILGVTHPSVLKHDGESYRFSLQRLVKDLGIQGHVIFHNRFVNDQELHNFLCAADVYVTPYLNREQLTSGTLSFAVGSGKAVISTPYWAAEELLTGGQGLLVPFGDSKKLAETIVEIFKDDSIFYDLRRKAYDYGRSRTWPKIGQSYWKLFGEGKLPARFIVRTVSSDTVPTSSMGVPEPSLTHIEKLTDNTGMYQHAKFTIPNRNYGYCTDDNTRAVIAMTKYYAQYPEPEVMRLFDIYLSFILHSQNSDGSIRNLMNFDRSWVKNEPIHDALGRSLWAFGTVMARPPSPAYLPVIKDAFDRSVKYVQKLYPRSMAYAILGMSDYLKQFPGASDIKRYLVTISDKLVSLYKKNSRPDWRWFENTLTYDNAILPYAMFIAGWTLCTERYLEVAEESCDFLLENTFNGSNFSFIGSNGWYKRNHKRACFDQQPIEVTSTIMMLRAAYETTLNEKFLTLQRKAFDWFMGENDLKMPIYNFRTKGCHDGLLAGGINPNQGAESTLSFMLSLLEIIESYASSERIFSKTAVSVKQDAIKSKKETARRGPAEPVPIVATKATVKTGGRGVEKIAKKLFSQSRSDENRQL
jgi:glycosyltransferase involved in cell wall biosynthesis